MYKHDLVSVGVDIYNIEAEALGCPMIYYEDNTLPSIDGAIILDPSDLKNLSVPDPTKAGRMPMFIEACQRINAKIGKEVPVGGTIVGPFTLAAILRGFENFLMDLLFEEEFAQEQLKFASHIALEYAKGFIKNGIGVSINESWITPPLLSPNLFKEKVFDIEKELITNIKAEGATSVALISGGNTTPIADYLVQTGTSLLMADANTEQKAYKSLCEKMNINLRASIESKIVELGNEEEMTLAVQKVIDNCASNGRFIFGCGVVSYNTSPENVIKLKGIVEKLNPYH
jgi:uroporphyrinogen decarboxylase